MKYTKKDKIRPVPAICILRRPDGGPPCLEGQFRPHFQEISMLFSTPGGGRLSRAPPFVKALGLHVHMSVPGGSSFVKSNTSTRFGLMRPLDKGDGGALQNLCRDCAWRCAVHSVRGYSSLIVYKRRLPVRMNFGSKQIAKANSSLRAVSARRDNHPDQCLHS